MLLPGVLNFEQLFFINKELKAPENKSSIARVCAIWKVALGDFVFQYLTSDSHTISGTTCTRNLMANLLPVSYMLTVEKMKGLFKLSNKRQWGFLIESSMQMAQNERLEVHKCCCALFTGRTNVNVFYFLYGDKDAMQLSCVSRGNEQVQNQESYNNSSPSFWRKQV